MQKKLYRSNKDKKLAGVCGGIAEYVNMDPTIIRLIAVLVGICAGSGLFAYIICAIIIPEKPSDVIDAEQ